MKNIILSAVITGLIFAGFAEASAAKKDRLEYDKNAERPVYEEININNYGPPQIDLKKVKKASNTQAFVANVDTFYQERPIFSMFGFNGITPISYDPLTNNTFFVLSELLFPSGSLTGARTNIYRRNNTTRQFDTLTIVPNPDYLNLRPSIAVVNDNEDAGSVSETRFITYASRTFNNDGTFGFVGSGGEYTINLPSFGQTITEPMLSPDNGNPPDNQSWQELHLESDFDANNTRVYGYNLLSPDSENDQYGYYGYWTFDYDEQNPSGYIPREWWVDRMNLQDVPTTSTFNSEMRVDNDENGNMYAGVINIFIDNPDQRLPGVSKSTDGGATWAAFEKAPASIFNQFLGNYDGYNDWGFPVPYDQIGFAVTGVDEYAFYTVIAIAGDDVPLRAFVTEILYEEGIWSVTAVHELESYGPSMITDYDPNGSQDFYTQVLLQRNYHGNQIQVSKSTDSDELIVAWIDITLDQLNVLSPPFNTIQRVTDPNTGNQVEQNVPVDTLYSTDIYARVKDLSTGNWNTTANLTNDAQYDKIFYLPDYYNDAEEVALVTLGSFQTTQFNESSQIRNVPQRILEMGVDVSSPHCVTTVDMTKPASSVETEFNLNSNVGDVYPNPARELTELSFTLDKQAYVTVDVFNTMGKRMFNVYEGNKFAGTHGLEINTNSLTSGTYYVNVNINGNTITKVLNIVK